MANTYTGRPAVEGPRCILKCDAPKSWRKRLDGLGNENGKRDRADKMREALEAWMAKEERRAAKRGAMG